MSLKSEMTEMEASYKVELAAYEVRLAEANEKFNKLKIAMAAQLRKYQELMSIKIGLDLEIATYRKLVESEEHRIEEINYGQEYGNAYSFNIWQDSLAARNTGYVERVVATPVVDTVTTTAPVITGQTLTAEEALAAVTADVSAVSVSKVQATTVASSNATAGTW